MTIAFASPGLCDGIPPLRDPIVPGLIRSGEVVNWIASPKTGKTWMLYRLLLAICTGSDWFGREVKQGKVLLIDNELHRETGLQRLHKVARSVSADLPTVDSYLSVAWLRGLPAALEEIEALVRSVPRGTFSMIALDAFYRFLGPGCDENANGDMIQVYNHIDRIAEVSGSAIINVHHASKGDQSQKGVTDVGSGAGVISRAVDTHIVYLRHAVDGCVVMKAVCRSFPPPPAMVLRIAPPEVTVEPDLDPEDLWSPKKASRGGARDWSPEEFVSMFVDGKAGKEQTVARAMGHGIPKARARELTGLALELELAELTTTANGRAGRPKMVLSQVRY